MEGRAGNGAPLFPSPAYRQRRLVLGGAIQTTSNDNARELTALASAAFRPREGVIQVNSVLTVAATVAGFIASLATVLSVWIDISDRKRSRRATEQPTYAPTSATVLTAEMHRPPDILRR